MKRVFMSLVFLGVCLVSWTQTPPQLIRGWERINIEDVGSFDIPPTMELQAGAYKSFKESLGKLLKMDSSTFQIIVQQKGLNEMGRDELSRRYARVMFKTEIGDGDLTLDFDISDFTDEDIKELDVMFRQMIREELSQQQALRLVQWYPLRVESINGMSCIHTSYKRQLGTNEPVIVHSYAFFNNDRNHYLMMSYREVDKDYWESDYQRILSSLRIRKRR